MKNQIEITVASLPTHEELVVEIFIDQQFLALLSQEAGTKSRKIEFANAKGESHIVYSLATVEEAIGRAKDRLDRLSRASN